MAIESEHPTLNANDASFHVACAGKGPPLLLLHGWPKYWTTWTPIMERLGNRFRLIAPDLSGFGDSDKPAGDCGPARHAGDIDAALIDDLVANMAKPGNLEGGFAYYRGVADERARAAARGEAPPPIGPPTCVRWTERDTAFDTAWADKLPDFFTDLDFSPFPDAGHFPHHEQPDRAATEIASFFDRLAAST